VCPLLSQPAMSSACIWSCHQIKSRAQPPVCELGDALPSPHHKNQYMQKMLHRAMDFHALSGITQVVERGHEIWNIEGQNHVNWKQLQDN
jgi:hypothetical protein